MARKTHHVVPNPGGGWDFKKGGGVMKRNLRVIGILVLVISLSFIVVSGCAKKQVVKEEVLTNG